MPDGLVNFIQGIYFIALAVGRVQADVVILFLIQSGVIQGCPLASFCFVVAFDPFLNLFDLTIEQKGLGIVRACADDVGCSLSSIDILPKVTTIFKFAKVLAGLHIKFIKSAIVPVTKWSATLASEIDMWIHAKLTGWVNINIASSAKYLGTYLGTTV